MVDFKSETFKCISKFSFRFDLAASVFSVFLFVRSTIILNCTGIVTNIKCIYQNHFFGRFFIVKRGSLVPPETHKELKRATRVHSF